MLITAAARWEFTVHRVHARARARACRVTYLVASFPGKSPAELCVSRAISILMPPYSNFESCATAAARKFNFLSREGNREGAALLNADCKEDNVDPRLRFVRNNRSSDCINSIGYLCVI
jgi:hypothetical protein